MTTFGCCCHTAGSKLYRLYDRGTAQIEKELDMVKLLRTVRNIKIFLKQEVLTPEMKLKIKHSTTNVIDIDTSQDEESDQS